MVVSVTARSRLAFSGHANSATSVSPYQFAALQQRVFHLQRLINATRNSFRGLRHAFLTEAAFTQEVIVFVLALPAAWLIAPGPAWFVAMIGSLLVLMAVELLNTGLEKLSDHVTPSHHPMIGIVKDYGSAAVFCGIALAGLVWLAAVLTRIGWL